MTQLLTDLRKLNIPNLPNSVEELMKIEELDLSNKNIVELPETICNLTNLKKLNLSCNEIEWLPRNFGKLTNLDKLDLCNNKYLTDISEISNLTNLQWLNLSGNQCEIPDLDRLQNLKELYLQCMDITDFSIDTILQAKNVEKLNIAQNKFENIEALGKLKNLRYIVFDMDDWRLKKPSWIENNMWRYKEYAINHFNFVYVYERIQ